jgi:cytochrome c-type biogenesis protein CcmH
MIAFVSIAALMVAAALAWILIPLLRAPSVTGVAREGSNVAILRDQLKELENDIANGTLTRDQYEQSRQDLERRVLEESQTSPRAAKALPSPVGAWTAAVVAGALPLAALIIYVALGNFDAFSTAGRGAPASTAAGQHDVSPEQIAKMIAELEARLEKEPNNADGWAILARTYYQLNRFPEATRAYEHAAALAPDDATLLADYADALGAAQGGLHGKALELVSRALAVDPMQWKALALAGTAAFERKDYPQAVVYWERMKTTVPPNSPIAKSIDASIAEARELGGLKPGPGAGASTAVASAGKATAVPAAKPAPAATATASGGGASIAGTASLAPALTAKVSPDDVVFIFARPAQGSRMPLAIIKKQVRDLPIAFTLDDSTGMGNGATLSTAGEVVVGARVSRSGQAIAQSGDVEGLSAPVKVGARGVAVVMDKTIP